MRIAVATDDGISIAGHFGRCAGFLIYDIVDQKGSPVEMRPNAAVHDHEPGECHRHGHEQAPHSHESFLNALHDCQAVICRGMGRRAVADLAARGIRPAIISEDLSASAAVEQFAAGKLKASDNSSCCSH